MRSRQRWRAAMAEQRARWQDHHHAHHRGHHRHHRRGPWWLEARLRLRIFLGFGVALTAGAWVGARGGHWWQLGLILFALWVVAGAMAWRLTRPLVVAIAAARAIGAGKLDTRVEVGHRHGELAALAAALNDMAARIEQQLRDQRALLAAVSHELRTPLGHLRVLIETARERDDWSALAAAERELLALDDLVGRLLASARLDFARLDRAPEELGALVADVALASGVEAEAITADGDTTAAVDPTLIRRAIANLLDNATRHGGGVRAVRIARRGDEVVIEVDDAGPGLPAERAADPFRAFVPSAGGGLGLGLSLIARIAAAHDGRAFAEARPGGGARVGFAVAVAAGTAAAAE
jgi:two-component system OmpR family sensor kinase